MATSDDRKPDVSAQPRQFSEDEFKAKLRRIGRLREPTGNVRVPDGVFTPVDVKGQPTSEVVVEERR